MIDAGICTLRPWRLDDVDALVDLMNDAEVSRNLTDRVPYPYTAADAKTWVTFQNDATVKNHFAIVANGELAGGIGIDPLEAERRCSAQIGYWLGRRFWGRGYATAACAAMTAFAFSERPVVRLEAWVYAPNTSSMRVLEKCGYSREGIMRKAIVKHGEILDAHLYARTNDGA